MPKPRLPVSTTAARRARGLVKNETMSAVAQSKRAGKYNARGCHLNRRTGELTHGRDPDRLWFASEAESVRYLQLKELERAGQIRSLRVQRPIIVDVHGHHICTYRPDFEYIVCAPRVHDEYPVTEDVKGMLTDVYDLKKKLIRARHGIVISEIPARQVKKWHMKIPPPPG